ncbi:MAG TPA: hypothetical protein VNU01_03980 [Egibacteraceae bacterium]|nr:hypothetical protein [Egibacteraceae bacterium]
MRRYLVVANRTLPGPHLSQFVTDCLGAGTCHFDIVVPATPLPGHWVSDVDEEHRMARERLEETLAAFRALGASAEGWVTDPHPIAAVSDALRGRDYDEIVVSTLPPGASRWLRMDLPSRLERLTAVPVTHLVAEPAHA